MFRDLLHQENNEELSTGLLNILSGSDRHFICLCADTGYVYLPKTVNRTKMTLLWDHLENVGGILISPRLGYPSETHVLQVGEDNMIHLIPTTFTNEEGEEVDIDGLPTKLMNHRTLVGTLRHGVVSIYIEECLILNTYLHVLLIFSIFDFRNNVLVL